MRADDWRVSKLFRMAAVQPSALKIAAPTTPSVSEEKIAYIEYHEKRGDIERAEELYTVPTSAHLQSFILRLLLLAESIFVLTFAVPLTFRGIGALVQSLHLRRWHTS